MRTIILENQTHNQSKREALTRSMLHNKKAAKQSNTITHLFGNCSHQGFACSAPSIRTASPSGDTKDSNAPVMPYSSDVKSACALLGAPYFIFWLCLLKKQRLSSFLDWIQLLPDEVAA